MKGAFFRPVGLLILLFFSLKAAFGQMSENLYQALPDSLRPNQRTNLTIPEFGKVIRNSAKLNVLEAREFAELVSLCYQLGPRYEEIVDTDVRLKFLLSLIQTLYNGHNLYLSGSTVATGRTISHQVTRADLFRAINYADIYIRELKKHTPNNKSDLSKAYYIRSFFYLEDDNFLETARNLERSLSLAKEANGQGYIGKVYVSFAHFYNLLDLPTQALAYCDSAQAVISQLEQKSAVDLSIQATIISFRQIAYLNKFIKQSGNVYVDSIETLHKQLVFDSYTNGRRKASSFIILAATRFYKQQYEQTLELLDSAQHAFPKFQLLILWQEAMVYKGISLLRLGRVQEGQKILESLDYTNVKTPIVANALEELVTLETRKGDRVKALQYQSLLLSYTQKRHEFEMQGKAYEMAQKYSLATRDAQILRLTELKERDRLVIFFMVLSVVLLFIVFLTRYRNMKAQTNRLVQQIEEITESQLAQIEEVQTLERKQIGQEIHDELASSIAMATRYLQFKAEQSTDAVDKNQTRLVIKTLKESYDLTRMKSHRLFQEDNARLFCQRLASKTELLFTGTNIQFTFTGEISGLVLSAELKTALVLVIKEAMTNIIKHAQASQAGIVLYYENGFLILEISDNGRGIVADQIKKGIGMLSLKNRIAALKGTIRIEKAEPSGTILDIHFPIPAEDVSTFVESTNLDSSIV